MLRRARLAILATLVLSVFGSCAVAAPDASPPATLLLVLDGDADFDAVARTAASAGARVIDRFDAAGVWVVRADGRAAAALATAPGVQRVLPDEPLLALSSRSAQAVGLDTAPSGPDGRPLERGANATIAIVDSGVDVRHPGFAGRVSASLRFLKDGGVTESAADADGHGTHVAGVALGSGAGSRNARHAGLAPEASLVALDISDSFTTSSAVRAFRWIHENGGDHGVRVVSNSWGREKEANHYDPDDPVVRASNALVADGVVVVFSAGNRGEDGRGTLTVEAVNPNVLAVGATDFAGRVEAYSSRGPAFDASGAVVAWTKPDIVAPGSVIVSARASSIAPKGASEEERLYVTMNGTSMAAPHVAAAAALLVSKDPTLTPAVVMSILQGTARDVGASGPDAEHGYGLLDVGAAVRALDGDLGASLITVVSRQLIRAEGAVTAAGGAVLLDRAGPKVPPAAEVVVPVELKPGAARIHAWFNWSSPSPTGDFTVTLVAPDGERLGPFPATRARSVLVAAPASAGTWQVRAQPSGVAVQTEWTLEGAVEVRETKALERTSLDLPAPRGLLGAGGFPADSPVTALSGWFDQVPMGGLVRTLAITGVLGLLVAGGVRRLRR